MLSVPHLYLNNMRFLAILLIGFITWSPTTSYEMSRFRRFLMDTDAISCNFESPDFCGYTQSTVDDFDWIRSKGSTPSAHTGPDSDHTVGTVSTYYIYTEGSSPRRKGDKARLISPLGKTGVDKQSVTFYFNMNGDGMGTLNVYVDLNQTQVRLTPSYTISGNQGPSWHYGCVNLPTNSTYKIIFEGIIGSNYHSDLAIDDIILKTGRCSGQYPTTGQSFTTTTSSTLGGVNLLSCNFENGDCGYTQDKTDDREWNRHVGNTTSIGTGPGTDHTVPLGTGHYMYFESSNPAKLGDKARFQSPVISSNHGSGSVRFWYHMYGMDMGTLNVYLKQGSSLGKPVFTLSGNQGNVWIQGCIEVPSSKAQFQLVFEAVRGASFHGDIAIDDITWSSFHCTSVNSKTTPYLSTRTTTDPSVIFVSIDIGSPQTNVVTTPLPGSVDGGWSAWGAYTACSTSCGRGTRKSQRTCNNPTPSSSGKTCVGASTKYQLCQQTDCQVDGAWSSWTTWSKCSASCGLGSIARIRMCNHPAPSGGGRNCTGETSQTHDCTAGPCAVWSSWYSGPCSVSCGDGTMEQFRHCSTGHDEDCTGSPFQQVPCNNPQCI